MQVGRQVGRVNGAGRSGGLAAIAASFAAALAQPASAAGTRAGTSIQNTATATYELADGSDAEIASNTVALRVDELLDVSVAWADPADVSAAPGQGGRALRFTVTNAGNGREKFSLRAVTTGGGDDFNPSLSSIVLDSNGNGAYDPGVDAAYVAGATDPELEPDQSLSAFVISSVPASAEDSHRGRVELVAEAGTGSGAPGTSFASQGEGGGDAVVGATGAAARADGFYKVSKAAMSFSKTATVADPFGGTSQTPGATITYSLTAAVSGSGTLANVRISDPIPAGTRYAPGSLTLDGNPLTDPEDADSGAFTGSAIAVGLGSLASGTTRTVTFKVTID